MKKRELFNLYPLLLALCVVAGCGGKTANHSSGDKPTVTVTLEPQRFFTEAIAGEKFHVATMVPKGTSPETYDPVPQQLVSLGDSKAYFRIGYIGFEQSWMQRLLDNAPHLQVFDTSKGITLITDKNHAHAADEDHQGHAHAIEPHVWNSTGNALIIAANTFKAFCTLDPKNETYYWERYDSLCRRIQHTDSIIRQTLAHPQASRAFIIYHPALSYFARDYGLLQISIEEGGKEPTPTHLKELIDRCKNEEVRIIFVQPEFDKRNAEMIAQQTGTRVVAINPLSYDWEGEMIRIAQALAHNEPND